MDLGTGERWAAPQFLHRPNKIPCCACACARCPPSISICSLFLRPPAFSFSRGRQSHTASRMDGSGGLRIHSTSRIVRILQESVFSVEIRMTLNLKTIAVFSAQSHLEPGFHVRSAGTAHATQAKGQPTPPATTEKS